MENIIVEEGGSFKGLLFSEVFMALMIFIKFLFFISSGLVGLAISYALSITNLLSGVVSSFTETEKQLVSVERANQYIEKITPEYSAASTDVSFICLIDTFCKKSKLLFYFCKSYGLPNFPRNVGVVLAPTPRP